jgi:hypothetical protein
LHKIFKIAFQGFVARPFVRFILCTKLNRAKYKKRGVPFIKNVYTFSKNVAYLFEKARLQLEKPTFHNRIQAKRSLLCRGYQIKQLSIAPKKQFTIIYNVFLLK